MFPFQTNKNFYNNRKRAFSTSTSRTSRSDGTSDGEMICLAKQSFFFFSFKTWNSFFRYEKFLVKIPRTQVQDIYYYRSLETHGKEEYFKLKKFNFLQHLTYTFFFVSEIYSWTDRVPSADDRRWFLPSIGDTWITSKQPLEKKW